MTRYFLQKLLTLLLILLSGNSVQAQVRKTESLNDHWKFIKEKTESANPDYKTWETVNLPHTYNISDGQSGVGNDAWVNNSYYRGPATYVKIFNISNVDRKNRTFIKFEAVSQVADVFINGVLVGHHTGAFTAFCFEITSQVKTGENVLMVKSSNETDKDIPPLSGDFTLFGGIYRSVWLITLKTVCVTPLDYASSGIYVKQVKTTHENSDLSITTKISNASGKNKKINVTCSILDLQNKTVVSSDVEENVPNNQIVVSSQSLTVKNPHLWNGTKDAYLYKAVVKIYDHGTIVDSISQRIGLRYFSIDPAKGFFLNGVPCKIKGVCRHQDRKGMGWAITNAQHDEDFNLIREMGANGVRLAHYPQASYAYSLCDSQGLMVWAELPLVNSVTNSPGFFQNSKTMLTELIRQNYNHPSIICWSLYNELGQRKTEDPVQLITELNQLAHAEDSTRFTVAAPNKRERPEKSVPDQIAFNAYPGWYGGKPEDMTGSLSGWNNAVGQKGVGVSEYGAGASINQHEQGMVKAPVPAGSWHPEEWQSIVHEINYQCIKEATFCWGSFVWNMFDFASAGRKEGDMAGINDKGLVTYDRKVKKDAFFFYKASWNTEPMVYITSRRHADRTAEMTEIKVYSNCQDVTLVVNGIGLGTVQKRNDVIYSWTNVKLQPGVNKIEAIAKSANGQSLSDTVTLSYRTK
jgi:beta-galactosidase